jgi:cell division protease FtsH
VKRILDEAHTKAQTVIAGNRDLLESIARALLERETLDRDEIETLARGGTLPPLPLLADEEVLPKLVKPPAPGKAPRGFGLAGGEGPLPGPAPGFVETPREEDLA